MKFTNDMRPNNKSRSNGVYPERSKDGLKASDHLTSKM